MPEEKRPATWSYCWRANAIFEPSGEYLAAKSPWVVLVIWTSFPPVAFIVNRSAASDSEELQLAVLALENTILEPFGDQSENASSIPLLVRLVVFPVRSVAKISGTNTSVPLHSPYV